MEYAQRGGQPAPMGTPPAQHNSPNESSSRFKRRGGPTGPLKIAFVTLLFSATILVVALVLSFFFSDVRNESRSISKDRLQAVFLNGGQQIYFGRIVSLNDKFIKLRDIYYLRVNQQVQPEGQSSVSANDISIVKLGCELHRPQDEMVISRDQVSFWENLKDESDERTIPGAIKKYRETYPNGQECAAPAAGQNSNAAQPSTGGTDNSEASDSSEDSN